MYNNSLTGPLGSPLPLALTFFSVSLNYLTGPIPAAWALPPNLRVRAAVGAVGFGGVEREGGEGVILRPRV